MQASDIQAENFLTGVQAKIIEQLHSNKSSLLVKLYVYAHVYRCAWFGSFEWCRPYLSWQLMQQQRYQNRKQQQQRQQSLPHGSCGSHSSSHRHLADVCQKLLMQQPKQTIHHSCRAHHHSTHGRSHRYSCHHIHGHSHLQQVKCA